MTMTMTKLIAILALVLISTPLTSYGQTVEIRRGSGGSVSTNNLIDTNVFRAYTNSAVIKVNNTNVIWPVYLTNSSTVSVTNTGTSQVSFSINASVTNNLIDTNSFSITYDNVVDLAYDGVETTVMLVNGALGSVFRGNLTKATTLRFTNFFNGALTNSSRRVDIGLRQDAVGTWAVGTQLTNAIVAFGVGGTNLGVRTNVTTISWVSGRTLMFTNSMMQLSAVTNSIP